MKGIAFLLLKGGIGKTTSATNFAYLLGTKHNKKVLLVDLDQQGNTSWLFGCTSKAQYTLSDLLVNEKLDVRKAIQKTRYPNIDVIASNESLIKANQDVLLDTETPQQERLRIHLKKIDNEYDYCIFDCPTATTMSTLNALMNTDDVICPIKIDMFAFDAISKSMQLINDMKEYNPKLRYAGAFVTMYQNTALNNQGVEQLTSASGINLFDTKIRATTKVGESTYFAPLCEYAPKSTAAEDYASLVKEYLRRAK